MLFVFTGDGKGKTTAAVGQVVRYLGAGKKVLLCQFFKRGDSSEIAVLRKLGVIIFADTSAELPVDLNNSSVIQRQLSLLNEAASRISSVDVAVLDEFNLLASSPLVTRENLESILDSMLSTADVIATGRNAPAWLAQKADLVTEMRNIKHYFDKGIPAERGREF